jgi:hypothetical protein
MPQSTTDAGPRWQALEFSLVVVMLGVLGALVVFILIVSLEPQMPQGAQVQGKDYLEYHKAMLGYRKDILSIILTAFGAWVGAGAAYFFGRENLREAATSMLRMRDASPQERLRHLRIRDIPPRKIDWTVKASDKLQQLVDRLNTDPVSWFIPVVNSSGVLIDVVHREGVSRYLMNDPSQASTFYQNKTVDDMISFLNTLPEEQRKRYTRIYVPIKSEMMAGEVNDLLETRQVYVAIVVDDKGKPVEFIDTGDLRRVLLR